jgi:hypothetical protein
MRYVSGEGFVVDDVYLTELWPKVQQDGSGGVVISWQILIKPLAVDDVLWAAFMPEVVMGPTMRINRRINGAFRIQPLTIATGSRTAAPGDEPEPHWDSLIDEFDAIRTDFVTGHPTAAHFLAAIRADAPAERRAIDVQRELTTLIAIDRGPEAAALAEATLAAGEQGTMSTDNLDVLELLAVYARGPEAYAAFMASLVPTHDLKTITEDRGERTTGLIRGRHHGGFGLSLARFDGAGAWGLILEIRATDPDNPGSVRYLQAAGSAQAMTVELRRPGGDDWGAVSVLYTVGHPQSDPDHSSSDVAIELPTATLSIRSNEVFTAEEATELFFTYYRADTIPDQYTLRAVRGYDADGTAITPPCGTEPAD